MTAAPTIEKRILWDDGVRIHLCEGTPADNTRMALPRLIWTKCGRDVPANAAFHGDDTVTCQECIGDE